MRLNFNGRINEKEDIYMITKANAKINLSLDIVSKREDGYHDVCMIMQEVDFGDEVELDIGSNGNITVSCDKDLLLNPNDNLAYRAAKIFYEKSGISGGCDIKIKKHIPACAGLGGGSSDAAAVLKMLNSYYDNYFSTDELLKIGLSLGADVPFCIIGGTALAEGIGEILTPIDGMSEKWIAILKPDADISTALAYSKADSVPFSHPDVKAAVSEITGGKLESAYPLFGNVFEAVAASDFPEVKQMRDYMYAKGAEFAMMSGSGSAVFGIFDSEKKAKAAFDSCPYPTRGGGCGKTVIR